MQIGWFILKLGPAFILFPLLWFRYPPSVPWQSLCIFNIIISFIYPSVQCSSCVLWPMVDCNESYSSITEQEPIVPLTLLETKPSKPRNTPKSSMKSSVTSYPSMQFQELPWKDVVCCRLAANTQLGFLSRNPQIAVLTSFPIRENIT